MKLCSAKIPRYTLTLLLCSCIFGNLFPFLNIDLKVLILTPFRTVLILVSIYCLLLWCKRFKDKTARHAVKEARIQWFALGFFALWFVLGAGWMVLGNPGSGAVTEVVGILTLCMLAFCCFTLVRDWADVRYVLRLLVLCGVILALIACIEVVIGNFVPGTRYYLSLEEKIARRQTLFSPTAVFFNPNDFAAFMLLCLSIVCFWIIQAKTTKDFLWCLGIALWLILPTVLTNSTFFYIFSGVLMGVTLLALLLVRGNSRKVRLLRAATFITAVALFFLFGVGLVRTAVVELNRSYFTAQIQKYYSHNQIPGTSTVPGQEPGQNGDIPQMPELDFSNMEDADTLSDQLNSYQNNGGTIHIRKWLIFAGWDFFTDSPLFGNGPDSFREMMLGNADYLKQTRGIVNPHCFYIELLSQYGGILFAFYIGIILYLAVNSLCRAVRELRSGQPSGGMLTLLLTGMFSAAVLMPSSIIRGTSLWIFLILSICFFSKKELSDSAENSCPPAEQP